MPEGGGEDGGRSHAGIVVLCNRSREQRVDFGSLGKPERAGSFGPYRGA
jgi:hypothetical protein